MQEQSLRDKVYEGISNDILDGIYAPNMIINEKGLIEKYHVSKTPVREALAQLCSEGILKNIPRFGYQISMITPSEIVETIEYRKIIEVGALESWCYNLTDEYIVELEKLNEYAKSMESCQDIKVHWKINERFHKKMCSFSGNRYLQKALDDSMKMCTRMANQYFIKVWGDKEKEDGNHYRLVKALQDGDQNLAKEILIYDIEMIRKKIL